MKWFKHHSDNYRGRSINSFHREFGHSGIAWYFLLTEICAEKLEKPRDRDLAMTDCTFSFDKVFVESSLRGTFAKIRRWLDHGVTAGLWTYTETEFELSVKYPILLELLDSDNRKTRSRREKDASLSLLDKEIEIDKEIDKEIEVRAEVKNSVVSAQVVKTTIRGCIPEFFDDDVCREFLKNVTHAAQRSWLDAYPSVQWIGHEIKKANAWIATNPKKAPKDRGKFMLNWLNRGFEEYRKTLKSNDPTEMPKRGQGMSEKFWDEFIRKNEEEDERKGI